MPQFAQRLGFDLADSLARHTEFTPDLFEGSLPSIVEPKA
jgi:hypothetical protein